MPIAYITNSTTVVLYRRPRLLVNVFILCNFASVNNLRYLVSDYQLVRRGNVISRGAK